MKNRLLNSLMLFVLAIAIAVALKEIHAPTALILLSVLAPMILGAVRLGTKHDDEEYLQGMVPAAFTQGDYKKARNILCIPGVALVILSTTTTLLLY